MHEGEKWKWSRSVVSDPQRPHGLQPSRLLRPWDFPGKSTGVGRHCLLRSASYLSAILAEMSVQVAFSFFWLGCSFATELYELYILEINFCQLHHLQLFSLVHGLSFHFIYDSLCYAKNVWLFAIFLIFDFLISLPYITDLRKIYYDLWQRMFSLLSLLEVLSCQALYFDL